MGRAVELSVLAVLLAGATIAAATAAMAGGYHVEYAFAGGGLIDVGGTLYGTTTNGTTVKFGTVFALDPTTPAETVLHVFKGAADGSGPEASLLFSGRKLYGTTIAGGGSSNCDGGCGTVFSITP